VPLSVAEVKSTAEGEVITAVAESFVAVGLAEEELEDSEVGTSPLAEGPFLNTAQTETSPLGLFTSTTQLLPLSHHPTPLHLSKE